MGEFEAQHGAVLYLELAAVFVNSPLQVAIDVFYDTSGGHEEGVHESVPVEETRPLSPGPAIAGTIHPLASSSKPAGKT